MALIDARDLSSSATGSGWADRLSPVTLRRLVVGGCLLCWAGLGLAIFG